MNKLLTQVYSCQEFGEAAAIIHRSVMETAVKLIWVCKIDVPDRTKRLIADCLKPELEFESQIRSNISAAGGEPSPLEQRMLSSIDNHFLAADLTKSDVTSSAKMPDLASMFSDIGWSRLQYVVLQRLGSHAVHGNWPSLLSDYLEESDVDGFNFMPRGQPVPMHPNLYMSGGRLVLNAIVAYTQASLSSGANTDFADLANQAHEMLIADYKHAIELGL